MARAPEVWSALAARVRPGPRVEKPVEMALGLVLAENACTAYDYPPFDRAVMDGYAVRVADFSGGAAKLRNGGLVRAGDVGTERLEPGACLQINTGAPLPAGADAVVMVEKSSAAGDGWVELEDAPQVGQNIERRAALAQRGQGIVPALTKVGPGTVAALVAAGLSRVPVFQRPRVALLSTGDELTPAGQTLQAGQIFDSNGVMLQNLVESGGGEPVLLGRCPDEPGALREFLRRGLENDVFCVTGGMSKGSHDLVPGLLEELGVQWLVQSLNLKPGKPTRIGRSQERCWVVGLPGNPVSCAVCFLLFVRCILEGLQGRSVCPPPHLKGTIESDLSANGERPMYHPAFWSIGPDGASQVRPLTWRGSGDPFGLALANALAYRPERAAPAPRGSEILFVPLDRPA